MDRFLANLEQVNPGVEHLLVSARTGEGVDAVPRLARGGGGPGGRAARDRRAARPRRRAACAADRGERAVFRSGGREDRPALPPDGGALRARREARGHGLVRPGAIGRAPRRGRVRAPGDRRQARPACHRARRRKAPVSTARLELLRAGRLAIAFGPERRRALARARGSWLLDDRLRAARRRVGVSCRPTRTRSWPRNWPRRITTCSGSCATCSSTTADCSRVATSGNVHDTGGVELPLSVPGRDPDRPRGRGGGRPGVGADEGGRGRCAARADAAGGRRGTARRRGGTAARVRAGGKLLALGNGGSATDAMDAVADLTRRRRAGRRTRRST